MNLRELPAFTLSPWQMSYGERTTLEGILCMLKPSLAIEIGRAEGGSLRRVAAYSREVISFDIVDPSPELAALQNVQALSGDSHAMLPAELKRLAEQGRNVDFVLVDGDHTTEGVRRDMEDLLASPAIANTVILAHDALNQEVRHGLTQVDYEGHEKVAWVDHDWVPGYVARIPERLGECWGGFGLVVVDSTGAFSRQGLRRVTTFIEHPKLIWPAAERVRAGGPEALDQLDRPEATRHGRLEKRRKEVANLAAELGRHRAWLEEMRS